MNSPETGAPCGAPAFTPETINCEPDWQTMFDTAATIARDEIAPNCGQMFVIEMLEFGKRLEEAAARRLAADVKQCHDDSGCTDCGELMRMPIAFNQLSRLTQKYVCTDCYAKHNEQLASPLGPWATQDDYI